MSYKKKIAKLLILAVAAAMPLAVNPTPAQAFNIGGAIAGAIKGGVQAQEAKATLKHYNDDEQARQELFEAMKEKQGVNYDYALNQRLGAIMTNLTACIGKVDPSIYDKPYNYFINTSDEFNAACGLGHNMTVNTGIFKLVGSDAEIAVVLGHEMGHGQKDHVLKGLEGKTTAMVVGGAISGGSGGTLAGNILANLASNQIAVQHTKGQEWEADNLAFDYISHSDYNIGACAAIWQRVEEKYGNNAQDFVGDIFSPSDHPSHKERKENYNKKMFEYSNKHVNVENGVVKVNKKDFLTPAATSGMSSAERAYFVAGNLARIYHNNNTPANATTDGSTVYMDGKAVMTVVDGDMAPQTIADKLNSIK